MTTKCQSGDSFTDYGGSWNVAECKEVAEFRWGPEGDSYTLFCDRHLLSAMSDEISGNVPEDLFEGEMRMLNHCGVEGCVKEGIFEHFDLRMKMTATFCDEHSMMVAPYWDTISYVGDKLPQVLV